MYRCITLKKFDSDFGILIVAKQYLGLKFGDLVSTHSENEPKYDRLIFIIPEPGLPIESITSLNEQGYYYLYSCNSNFMS